MRRALGDGNWRRVPTTRDDEDWRDRMYQRIENAGSPMTQAHRRRGNRERTPGFDAGARRRRKTLR